MPSVRIVSADGPGWFLLRHLRVRSGGGTAHFGENRAVVSQGEVWWVDLPPPVGSGPGFRRSVIVIQCDAFNPAELQRLFVPTHYEHELGERPRQCALILRRNESTERFGREHIADNLCRQDTFTRPRRETVRAKLELILAGLDAVLGR